MRDENNSQRTSMFPGNQRLYQMYEQRQEIRHESLSHATAEIRNTDTYKNKRDYLVEAVNAYKELLQNLSVPDFDDGATVGLKVSTALLYYDVLIDYSIRQVTTLSAYAALVNGVVKTEADLNHATYAYALAHSDKIGLGFDELNMLYDECNPMLRNTSVDEFETLLNSINRALRYLVRRYEEGSTKLGKMNMEERTHCTELIIDPERVRRMCEYYNKNNELVDYVNRYVTRFRIRM